jgi:hypothetical protein
MFHFSENSKKETPTFLTRVFVASSGPDKSTKFSAVMGKMAYSNKQAISNLASCDDVMTSNQKGKKHCYC